MYNYAYPESTARTGVLSLRCEISIVRQPVPDTKLPLSQNWERGPGGETGTGDRTTLAGIIRLVEQARITE